MSVVLVVGSLRFVVIAQEAAKGLRMAMKFLFVRNFQGQPRFGFADRSVSLLVIVLVCYVYVLYSNVRGNDWCADVHTHYVQTYAELLIVNMKKYLEKSHLQEA